MNQPERNGLYALSPLLPKNALTLPLKKNACLTGCGFCNTFFSFKILNQVLTFMAFSQSSPTSVCTPPFSPASGVPASLIYQPPHRTPPPTPPSSFIRSFSIPNTSFLFSTRNLVCSLVALCSTK